LTKFARDNAIMDLEEARGRLSAYPALAAGFGDRGVIREGAPADVVVCDLENLEVLEQEKASPPPRTSGGECATPRVTAGSSSTAR
jgi:N-acyl-D-aspartate/D-glutamate deacylase